MRDDCAESALAAAERERDAIAADSALRFALLEQARARAQTAEAELAALRSVPVCPYIDCQHPALSAVGIGGPVRADDLVPLRAALAAAEAQRDEARDILRLAGEAGRVLAAGRDAPWSGSTEPQDDEVVSGEELRASLARAEKAERERDEAQLAIASATDLVNTWCRETSIEEATRPADCKAAIERLWMHFGGATAERDAALEEKRVGAHLFATCLEAGYDAWRAVVARAEAAEAELAALRKRIDDAPVAWEWWAVATTGYPAAKFAVYDKEPTPCDGYQARRVRILEVPDGAE